MRRPVTLICSWECSRVAEGIVPVKPNSAYEIGTHSQRNRYRFYGTYFSVPILGGTYFTVTLFKTVRPRVIYLRRPTAAASRPEPYTRYQPRYFQPQPLQRSTQPSPAPRWVRRHCTACGRLLQINSTTHYPFQRIDQSSDPPRHPTESLLDPYDRPVPNHHKGRPVLTPVTSHIQPDRRLSLWFMSVIFSVFYVHICANASA